MAKAKHKPGGAETEVLKVLWSIQRGTVRDIDAALRRKGHKWATTTIHTLLSRLRAKELVKALKSDGVFVFEATVDKAELARREFRKMATDLGGGISVPIVRALVERTKLTPEEIAELRKIIDNLDES